MSNKMSHSIGVQLTSRNILTLDELELYELCQLAGIVMEPSTFKIILDLLKMNVSPQAVLQMLKTMCVGKKKSSSKYADAEGTENMPPPRQKPSRHPSGSSSGTRRVEAKR